MTGSPIYLAARPHPALVVMLAELAALFVGGYLVAVVYWVVLTKERFPRWREFAWGVTARQNLWFVVWAYVLIFCAAAAEGDLLAAINAHPATATILVALASPALVSLGKVLWTKAGSSINQAVRLKAVAGAHAGGACLDLVVDNCTDHNVYNVCVREIAGSPGHLAQLPPPLVALLTTRGIGVVPTDGLRFCLGPVARYASPADSIMIVASWLDRSPQTSAGAEREQKPDDCVSVIDLYASALQVTPAVVPGQGVIPVIPPVSPAIAVALTAGGGPAPALPTGANNGIHPPTP